MCAGAFQIPGAAVPEFSTLRLGMNYDDGFVAYLNGTEVARRNAPDSLAWNSVASAEHGGILAHLQYGNFDSVLDQADFTLGGDARWFFGRMQLTGSQAGQTSAVWTKDAIPFGSDYSFNTSMAIDVYGLGGGGGEGMTFVLQSGGRNQLGSGGGGLGLDNAGMAFVAVEFDSDRAGSFDLGDSLRYHVGIDTSTEGSVERVLVDRFNNGSVGQNIRYVWIDYNGRSDQLDVYFSAETTKPAEPTVSATVDLEELFGGVPTLWAGWTAATSTKMNSHDVLAWEFTAGAGQLGMTTTEIDISPHMDLLKPGQNVLAVHGLNLNNSDEDFLVAPALWATQLKADEPAYFTLPSPGQINGLGGTAGARGDLLGRHGRFHGAFQSGDLHALVRRRDPLHDRRIDTQRGVDAVHGPDPDHRVDSDPRPVLPGESLAQRDRDRWLHSAGCRTNRL